MSDLPDNERMTEPDAQAGGNGNGDAPQTPKTPPRRSGGRRALRWLAALVLVVLIIVVLALGTVFFALTTEPGTRYLWQAATSLLGGRLTGKLDGGAVATGLQLRDVHWKSLDGKGTDIAVDSVSG
ncbi:hypothetical protein, partial [Caballeronia sp. AZ10_KS36]|uniref:hypothetical protein n=1 Tax=Caballeronia sp. AZ10_KS36 TaxID=2921757 RepID=UPI0020286A1A